jgi:hypothetical protein
MSDYRPGQLVRNQGIFTTLWAPEYSDNTGLGVECEIFAAPKDLRTAPNVGKLLSYDDTVEAVANLSNFHGYDGGRFIKDNISYDDAIVSSLAKAIAEHTHQHGPIAKGVWFQPSATGKWFIPPRVVATGNTYNIAEDEIKKASNRNLFNLSKVGAFAGTFKADSFGACYLTSTMMLYYRVICSNFANGKEDWCYMSRPPMNCRPVRIGRVRYSVDLAKQ